MTADEGFIEVPGGRVWYRAVGDQTDATPLLCLHGGPGFTHYYLEPLETLAEHRRVIFYDQLGCGRSDRPDDVTLWTVDRFVEELAQVHTTLQLERLHLFGSSWGGMLAMQYVLDRQPDLQSLTLVIIEDASHLCFAEQPSEFNKTINSFFDRTDRVSTP